MDDAVLAIGLSYEVRSLVEKITSYASASGPGSTVVNEVENAYNDFWQLATQWQEHYWRREHREFAQGRLRFANGSFNTIRPRASRIPTAPC